MKTPFASKHEVSIEPKNKNKQRKIFRDAIMFSFFLRGSWMENCASDYYFLFSTSDVVGGPSKISFNAGAMTFRDACALRCL